MASHRRGLTGSEERMTATSIQRTPISVLVPTRNEIRNLSACLEALQDWADEIVVVDSQSVDGTIELAESCGAVVEV